MSQAYQQSLEEKLIHLEEKLLFQEDAVHKLDGVIATQYDLIDGLVHRITALEEQMNILKDDIGKQPMNSADEKPPHY